MFFFQLLRDFTLRGRGGYVYFDKKTLMMIRSTLQCEMLDLSSLMKKQQLWTSEEFIYHFLFSLVECLL
jgi:hypothetical protein